MGGTICPPPFQYTLYPLYSGGLWEAVNTIPQIHFNFLTAKDNSGVGLKDEKRNTFKLFAEKIFATILARYSLSFLQSKAITISLTLFSILLM